jgi:hypothetical protein
MSECFTTQIPEIVSYKPLLHRLDEILHSRGPLFLIKYVKKVRNQYMNYLSDNPERVDGIGLTKDGIPIILGELIGSIRQAKFRVLKDKEKTPYHFVVHQTLMTILFSTRSLKSGIDVDVQSIIGPCTRVKSDITMYTSEF